MQVKKSNAPYEMPRLCQRYSATDDSGRAHKRGRERGGGCFVERQAQCCSFCHAGNGGEDQSDPEGTGGASDSRKPLLVRAGVEEAKLLFDQGIAEPTQRRHDSVWKKYLAWCRELREAPLPITEEKAMGYVVILACEGLQGTVKQHLAGLRQALKAGLAAPVWSDMARLAQIRKGIARNEAVNGKEKLQRYPVKWAHMQAMKTAWEEMGDKGTLLWAAACMCFFGCLRAGEALAPEKGAFDEKAHLGWEDVELENAKSPSTIRVRIKESKTNKTTNWRVRDVGKDRSIDLPSESHSEIHDQQKGRPGAILQG